MVLTDTEALSPSANDPRDPVAPRPQLSVVEAAVVAAVVLVGIALRFWTSSHLWLDEALTVDIARLPLADIPAALRQDGHPPLYYFLLHEWMRLFGQSDLAVRALSGVIGVATLPLGWLAARRAGGTRAAWAFVVLLALSPFAIRYATEARMYSLVMLLVMAGYLLVSNALERTTPLRLLCVALVSGCLLLTHYWALWLVAAAVVVLALRARDVERRGSSLRVLGAVVAGGVLLLPWLPSMLYQSAHTGTPWAAAVRPTSLITESLQDFGGGSFAEALLFGWGMLGLFVLGLFAVRVDDRHLMLDVRTVPQVRREALLVGVTLAIAAAAGYATSTTFATRYIAVVFPIFLLVAAVGLTRLDMPVVRPVVVAALLILGLVGGLHNVVTDRTQSGDIATALRAEAQPGDVVVICPDQLGPSLHRLLPGSLEQVVYPTFAGPDRVDWRDYADRNAKADPVAFAGRVGGEASNGPAHAVWLVTSGSYKTLEGQCEALTGQLSATLGPGQPVVEEDAEAFYEHAALIRFPGPASK